MFIIIIKNPKLIIIKGADIRRKIGLIKILINPNTEPAMINVKISPPILKPGKKRSAKKISQSVN